MIYYLQQLHFLLLMEKTRINLSPYNAALSAGFHCNRNISVFVEMHKSKRNTNLDPYFLLHVFVDVVCCQLRETRSGMKKISTQARLSG